MHSLRSCCLLNTWIQYILLHVRYNKPNQRLTNKMQYQRWSLAGFHKALFVFKRSPCLWKNMYLSQKTYGVNIVEVFGSFHRPQRCPKRMTCIITSVLSGFRRLYPSISDLKSFRSIVVWNYSITWYCMASWYSGYSRILIRRRPYKAYFLGNWEPEMIDREKSSADYILIAFSRLLVRGNSLLCRLTSST